MPTKAKEKVMFREELRQRLKNPKFAKAFAEADAEVRLAVAIAEAREREGLTQADLAKKLQTNQSNISRIERGSQNLTLGTIEKIANALHRRVEIRLLPL
jgi:ribosome-binding protein aMBF1 (putative translation factor)